MQLLIDPGTSERRRYIGPKRCQHLEMQFFSSILAFDHNKIPAELLEMRGLAATPALSAQDAVIPSGHSQRVRRWSGNEQAPNVLDTTQVED